eukprot:g4313.t1
MSKGLDKYVQTMSDFCSISSCSSAVRRPSLLTPASCANSTSDRPNSTRIAFRVLPPEEAVELVESEQLRADSHFSPLLPPQSWTLPQLPDLQTSGLPAWDPFDIQVVETTQLIPAQDGKTLKRRGRKSKLSEAKATSHTNSPAVGELN